MESAEDHRGRKETVIEGIGPPPEDIFAFRADLPSTDELLLGAVRCAEAVAPAMGFTHAVTGEMSFDHISLVGPPIRLQGGLHAVARIVPALRAALPGLAPAHDYAVAVEMGAAINLFEPVQFRADVWRRGERWVAYTRIADHDRLTGWGWSLSPTSPLLEVDLDLWSARAQAALSMPELQVQILGFPYTLGSEALVTAFRFAERAAGRPGLRRFLTPNGRLAHAFIAYHLDNAGVLVRAVPLRNPLFTTRLAIAFARADIDPEEPVTIIANRRGIEPDQLTRRRPLRLRGREEGGSITEVVVLAGERPRLVARGWVSGHPVDFAKIHEGLARVAEKMAQAGT